MTFPSDPQFNSREADLAAAFALGCADPKDQIQAESLMAESDAFIQTVYDHQATVAELAYSSPVQRLNPHLKSKLFSQLGLAQPSGEPDILEYLSWSIDALLNRAETLNWASIPSRPEIAIATLSADLATRTTAFFVKSDIATTFPHHEHAEGEVIRVLAGDLIIADQVFEAGSRIESDAGTAHQPKTQSGCLIFCFSSMDDKYGR